MVNCFHCGERVTGNGVTGMGKVFNAEWQSSRVAEIFRAACGSVISVGRSFIKVFNAEWQRGRVAEVSRAACGSVISVGRSFIKVFNAE